MDYRIRQGSPTDGPVLTHIERACRLAAHFLPEDSRWTPPRMWRQWSLCAPPFNRNPSERKIYIAYQNSDILGFAAAALESMYGGYDAHIHAVLVLPRFRRQRIGFALLHFLASWLDRAGVSRATVHAYAADPSAAFYHRMGGFVIDSANTTPEPTSIVTYGFPSIRALALNIE